MAKQVKPKHGGGMINRFEKGESGNPNGRPRKLVSKLVDQGYKKSEIDDMFNAILALTTEEIKEIDKNPDATILERSIARELVKDLNRCSSESVMRILEMQHGNKSKDTLKVNFINPELANKIAELQGMSIEQLENEHKKRRGKKA